MGAIYEGDYYLVVSGKSGNSFPMYVYPEVSPDRLRMVAVLDDEMVGASTIRLWRIEQNELIEEFYYDATAVGYYNMYSFANWQDNNTVIVNRFVHSKDVPLCIEPSFVEAQFALRKIGGSWELDKEPFEGTVKCIPY
jgi:hypothetical protein